MARILPFRIYNSYTAGNKPSLDVLKRGELAINMVDNILFYRTGEGDESQDTLHEFKLTAGGLAELEDLLITSPVANQVLAYNEESDKWENKVLTASMVSDFIEEVKKIAIPREGGEVQGKISYAGVESTTFEAQDLVTKAYVDAAAAGFVAHDACQAGATENVEGTYADGTTVEGFPGVGATFTLTADTGNMTTVAGVTLVEGMRVLLVGQTDKKQNGAYVVTTVPAEATGNVVLTRADDFDGHPKTVYKGAQFLISEGTNKGSVFKLKNETLVFGTDEIEFALTYTATSYQGADGVQVNGNVISLKQGATVQVIDGKVEVSSGTGNTGKVLMAGADGAPAEWGMIEFTNYVTLDGAQEITGLKTHTVAPLITAEQTISSDGSQAAKVSTVKTVTTYTDKSENGTTVALGGIPKGTKLENVAILDVIDQLLHPYVAPSGTGLSLTPTNGGTFEMGSIQKVAGGTVRWSNGSTLVKKAEILSGGETIGSVELTNSATSAAITLDAELEIKANKSFNARITDGKQTYTGGNVQFNFVYPFYNGVVAADQDIDGTVIAGLTKSVSGKGNKTISFTTSGTQQAVFAYPASYGNLKSIMDQNNFENIDAFTKSTVQVTGLDGTAQNYNVYVVNVNVTGFSYTFKF